MSARHRHRRGRPRAALALALLPLLLGAAVACGHLPEGETRAPAGVPAVPVGEGGPDPGDDGRGRLDAAPADARRMGEVLRVRGRELGRHLDAVLTSWVDPAVPVRAGVGPPAGRRWVGAGMSFVNVGGDTYGPLGSVWAHDSAGRSWPAVATGELTTGRPLVLDSLAVGSRAEGWVVFEIPDNARIVRLQYRDANVRANSGEGFWTI
ncbi:hypothetical protein ACN20G_15045 [Streptomyces sp. BI20]|uniref:hypothetical protein n=1 Tax=Streptomyces sp. BI20 TaxID=3403460 RepID=UPI003C761A8B